jgi:hypothetical protein
MMLCFGVSKELGIPITTLLAELPPEVILGYSAYFSILNEQQAKAMGR